MFETDYNNIYDKVAVNAAAVTNDKNAVAKQFKPASHSSNGSRTSVCQ